VPDQPLARRPFDVEAYVRRVRTGPCFVCATTEGNPDYQHEILYDDPFHIAFLARYPTLLGHCLVAPKRHVEDWVHELSEEQFTRFQIVVQRIGKAVAAALPTERMYSLSLGSREGNAHLHWHLAPLPPGVPYEEQQFHALMAENGVLDLPPGSHAEVGARIRRELASQADREVRELPAT
jgi:diadenosine tetraphosphate (Ap4A) HIT family hydrolase